ncbi:DUF4269 domain-containing protein [Bacillus pinisoli]|uniref:DUF4269 domain-containing protein n=1 Tax=Bacillus pinisoli TaxID=2901866 RepID=UPI001FF64941|nr:DUF4269 domain-containing protein [Bacillus pinisoli]
MFDHIDYLQFGNSKQKSAYNAIRSLGIIDHLSEYHPILCGTLPIEIDIDGSDLDLIFEVYQFSGFEEKVKTLYGDMENFMIKRTLIREVPVVKANFIFEGFEFELFGQPKPVKEQYAYLHMIIEYSLLKQFPHLKAEVMNLKKQGFKTEPAFCMLLGLEGDPYEQLLDYGTQLGII